MNMKKVMIFVILCIYTGTFCMAQSSVKPNLTSANGINIFTDNDTRFTWYVSDGFYFCAYNSKQIDLYGLIADAIPDPKGNGLSVIRDQTGGDYDRMIWSFLREHNEYDTVFYFQWISIDSSNIYMLEVDATQAGSPGVGYGFRIVSEIGDKMLEGNPKTGAGFRIINENN